MKIIIPKRRVILDESLPLFFLAGPVRGGGDWQTKMCRLLQQEMGGKDFYAVVPCRWDQLHPLREFFVLGEDDIYSNQTEWERYHLEIAGLKPGNCIIFWLGCESASDPRQDGHYACDTRGELGEWRGRMMHESVRLVIGADRDFPGLKVIKQNYDLATKSDFLIYPTMLLTVFNAITESKSKK